MDAIQARHAGGSDPTESITMMMDAIAASASVTEVFRALFLYATRISPADGIFVAAYAPETGLRHCVYSGSLAAQDRPQNGSGGAHG